MKKVALLLALLMLSAALFGGCTNPAKQDPQTTPGQQGGTPQPGTPANTEPTIFRYGVSGEWADGKNPHVATYAMAWLLYKFSIYEQLVDLGDNNEMIPRLAESWDVSEDGCTWTFHLRQDVKWHDGEAFTAEDVKHSYQMTIDFQLPADYTAVKEFTEINVIDEYTIEFVTAQPMANMAAMLRVFITPEHIYNVCTTQEEAMAFVDENMIGTGPFCFYKDAIDEYVHLTANDNYWGGRPKFDELLFTAYSNNDTLYQALISGEVDFCGLTSTQFTDAENQAAISTNKYSVPGLTELGFNSWTDPASKGNPLILNKYIRQAIDHAINYDQIIEYAIGGFGDRLCGLLPVAYTQYYRDFTQTEQYREYSPEKAMALLDANGFTDKDGDGIRESADGSKLEFRFSVIESRYREQALLIEKYLKEVGIKVNIEFLDSGRQSEIIYEQDFDTDMYIWGWTFSAEDPSNMLSILLTSEIGMASDCNYSNAEYDELFIEQTRTIDLEARKAIINRMLDIVYDECPYLMLYGSVGLEGMSNAWTGWQHQPAENGTVWCWKTLLSLEKVG